VFVRLVRCRLIVFSSDNGGPIYGNGTSGGNNFPLRGGKASNFEGGIRVNGWVGGGALHSSLRGMHTHPTTLPPTVLVSGKAGNCGYMYPGLGAGWSSDLGGSLPYSNSSCGRSEWLAYGVWRVARLATVLYCVALRCVTS
jgi:hypothetical protein